jgi:CHAT domain-containing protein/Tfp pilus assembly protein PilF
MAAIMPLTNAILILFVVGSSTSAFCTRTTIAGNGGVHFEAPQTTVRETSLATESEPEAAQESPRRLAEIAFAEATLLKSRGTAESLRHALEKYEKALGLWKSLNDRPGEATALDGIGTVHYLLGERPKALDAFQQELQIWKATGDRQNKVAEALNNIAVVYGSMGFLQDAIKFHQEALPLRRAAGDRAGLANTLNSLGLLSISTGELQKASDYCNQARAIFAELDDRDGLANTLNSLGGIDLTLGDYRRALEYFGQALELRRARGQRRDEAIALNNIGRVYDLLGEAQKALDYHHQALELRRTLGDPAMEAGSINNIGFVYDWLGEKQKALEHYKQAHDLFRAANDLDNQARTLINIGAYYLNAINDPTTALDYFHQALEITRALRQPMQQATVLGNIGLAHQKSGNLAKALEYHRQSLDIRRATGHRLEEAASLYLIGSTYFAMGELAGALEYLNQALRLYRATGNRGPEAGTLFAIARLERGRGNLEEALLRMQESLKIIESLRGSVSSQDLRASFLAEQQDFFEFYTDLLMRLHQREPAKGHDVAAFHSSERARARSLLELLAEARIDVEQGIAPELKHRERLVNKRIAWIQSRLIDAYTQAQLDQSRIKPLEEELKQVDAEREQLNSEIRKRHPRYAYLQYPAPLELKAIQSLLDDQTILLEYALGKDSSFLFAVTRNDFAVARLSSEASIASQVEALRATIIARPQRSMFPKQIEHSRKLYRELIEPAGKLLSGKRKLIIVPSGILHYLPFEVLLSSGEASTLAIIGPGRWPYLLKDFAVSYAPSGSVLGSLRDRAEISSTRKTFLAFADPAYVNDKLTEAGLAGAPRGAFGNQQSWKLGPLPESRREVEQIAGLYRKDQVSLLLGAAASEEHVKVAGQFKDYRYVHFATHGLLNEDRPSYSGLILSLAGPVNLRSKPTVGERAQAQARVPAAKESVSSNSVGDELEQRAGPHAEDGLLQVYEIFNLKLNADLVVLSACETGLGKQVKGEGLVGLTHAFFYAGTPSILVSLWKVQDRSTADLMVNFYRQLDRDKDKTEALRLAKLQLIQQNRYAHPYYWAPFVLTGEPK